MNHQQIREWLLNKLAARLRIAPGAIDVDRPLEEYGIDSMEAVALTGELETWLGRRLEPTVFWDYRTLAGLVAHLAGDAPAAPAAKSTLSEAEVADALRAMPKVRA